MSSIDTILRAIRLVSCLRDRTYGCPWDIKQTHESLAPFVIEEAYEAAYSMRQGCATSLKSELGDVLFQVLLHSELAQEAGAFSFEDVVDGMVEKMLRRHPHVFLGGSLEGFGHAVPDVTEDSLRASWKEIKQRENQVQTKEADSSAFSGLKFGASPLKLASNLQSRAAQHRFDWPEIEGVFEKLSEEISELKMAIKEQSDAQIQHEMGDVFFTCVNLARHLGCDSEASIAGANERFELRFRKMEAILNQEGLKMESLSTEVLEMYWQKAKASLESN